MKHKEQISQMTLEEKCSLLSGGTQFTTKALEHLGIPSIFLSDGPHGIRKQAGSTDHLGLNPSLAATCYPVAATAANSWDTQLAEELGEYLGKEARSQRLNVLLGPGMNIKRNPLCGRNFEYFSEDPYLTGKMAAAYIRGIQSKGIAACPKHFAVNSQETYRMTNDSILDERTLREIYLTAFEIAVKEGKPKSIMSSYNLVNGQYSNDSEKLLTDILVKEWGFDGFVVTDWGGSNDRVQGVLAGNHLEMPATKGNSDREIITAVRDGKIPEELVDRRIAELLTVLTDIVYVEKNEPFDLEQHHEFARKAAQQSIVLLKNDEQILPAKSTTKVAVIGNFAKIPRYQGAGSSLVVSTKVDIPLDEIQKSELKCIGFAEGFLRNGGKDEALKKEALKLAKKAELVLYYMGLDETAETEGQDRRHMRLNENQIELLKEMAKLNENIVVILSAGSAIEMGWEVYAKAIVHGYLGGQAGAGAMVDVLVGKVNPSGKVAESYPMRYGDVPCAEYYPGNMFASEYREGIYVGYRYYEKAKTKVRYPFGFGLSYTRFEYLDLKVKDNKVTFKVINVGSAAGGEVAQLYISSLNQDIFVPQKELKGFRKVYLEPGESTDVEIILDDKAFRYFNTKTDRFEILGGEYEILAAASSADIRLKTTVTIAGTNAELPYGPHELSKYRSGEVADVTQQEFEMLLGYPLKKTEWNKDEPISRNHPIDCIKYAKSPVARLVYKVMNNKQVKAEKKGKPDLNILFICNMPFRGIAKMMGGTVDIKMVDAMLTIINGHFFKGCGRLIKSYLKMRKGQKGGIQ